MTTRPRDKLIYHGQKYLRLHEYLAARQDEQEITLSFAEIILMVKGTLPPSAYVHRSWWANSYYASQSRAWLAAGFHTERVHLEGQHVTFVRGL